MKFPGFKENKSYKSIGLIQIVYLILFLIVKYELWANKFYSHIASWDTTKIKNNISVFLLIYLILIYLKAPLQEDKIPRINDFKLLIL